MHKFETTFTLKGSDHHTIYRKSKNVYSLLMVFIKVGNKHIVEYFHEIWHLHKICK
jgi:hypothetical protein